MEIKRDYYLDKLIREKGNGFIKIIIGIRRSGKSYLLNNIFYNHLIQSGVDENGILTINLFDFLLDKDSLDLYWIP